MPTPVYFLTPVARVERSFRRYASCQCVAQLREPSGRCREHGCPGQFAFHDARMLIAHVEKPVPGPGVAEESPDDWSAYRYDSRWPRKCECGYVFGDRTGEHRQVRDERLYSGCPDGQLYTLRDAPVGAMWDAWWMTDDYKGADGLCLVVKTPGGDWMVDGRASNCTRPDDWTHRCWTRTGDPRTGMVTVGKTYGPTCAAGAGSIAIGRYHGFLVQGLLTD